MLNIIDHYASNNNSLLSVKMTVIKHCNVLGI